MLMMAAVIVCMVSPMVAPPCANAVRDFHLNRVERDSIENHMFPLTPIPPRYLEGYLVTVADKISATRETVSLERFYKPKVNMHTSGK